VPVQGARDGEQRHVGPRPLTRRNCRSAAVEHTGPMRIEKTDGTSLSSVAVALTRGEAAERRDAVTDLLARFNDPDFHVHVRRRTTRPN
jgi:hypothetical protein